MFLNYGNFAVKFPSKDPRQRLSATKADGDVSMKDLQSGISFPEDFTYRLITPSGPRCQELLSRYNFNPSKKFIPRWPRSSNKR